MKFTQNEIAQLATWFSRPRIGTTVNALEVGVLGDGTTDDGPAINAALQDSNVTVLEFPDTGSAYRIEEPIIVPAGKFLIAPRPVVLEADVGTDVYSIQFEDTLWQTGGGADGFNLDLQGGSNGVSFYQCKFPSLRNMAILGNGTSNVGILLDGGLGEGSDGEADSSVMGGTTFFDLRHLFLDKFLDTAIRFDTTNFRFALVRKIATGNTTNGSGSIPYTYTGTASVFDVDEYISSARSASITTVIGSPTVSIADTSDIPVGANVICAAITYDAEVISKTAGTLTLNRNAFKDGVYTATIQTDTIPAGAQVGTNAAGTITLKGGVLATRTVTGAFLMERITSAGLRGAWCNRGISRGVQIQGSLVLCPNMIGADIVYGATNNLEITTQACKIGVRIRPWSNNNQIHVVDESRSLWSVQIEDPVNETAYWGNTVNRTATGNMITGIVGVGYTYDGGGNTTWDTNEKQYFPKQSSIPALTSVVFTVPTATIAPIRMPAGVGPGTVSAGSLWHDSTSLSWHTRTGNVVYRLSGVWYTATTDKTIASTTTETSLISTTGIGTRGYVANSLAIGKSHRFVARGFVSTTGTPTLTLRLKMGTVVVASVVVTMPSGASNIGWTLDTTLTVRTLGASGTCYGQGTFIYGTQLAVLVATAAATIDTTASITPDLTAQWGTSSASNTITATNGMFEMLS